MEILQTAPNISLLPLSLVDLTLFPHLCTVPLAEELTSDVALIKLKKRRLNKITKFLDLLAKIFSNAIKKSTAEQCFSLLLIFLIFTAQELPKLFCRHVQSLFLTFDDINIAVDRHRQRNIFQPFNAVPFLQHPFCKNVIPTLLATIENTFLCRVIVAATLHSLFTFRSSSIKIR